MKTKVSNFTEFRAYYLSEFELYDGEAISLNLNCTMAKRSSPSISSASTLTVMKYRLP